MMRFVINEGLGTRVLFCPALFFAHSPGPLPIGFVPRMEAADLLLRPYALCILGY